MARKAGAVALAGVCVLAASGCALAALWIYAVSFVGASGAPLIVAGILLVAGLATGMLASRFRAPVQAQPDAVATAMAALAMLTKLTRAHHGPMLLAALVAGIAAGTRRV